MHQLPAVLVGGPPHAGKSVLFYRLTQALRARGIEHYALRACPDGEGNWSHESNPALVNTLRVKLTGEWPPVFVQLISQALEQRCVPFLVDMGGCPSASDVCLLQACTHSILLLRKDEPIATQRWQHLIKDYDILPLARLWSQPTGAAIITAREPVLEGVITGLERRTANSGAGAGALFDELLEQIITFFTSYDLPAWQNHYLEQAPTELRLDVQQELRAFTISSTSWEPTMLLPLLARWPGQVPLSVYGSGPGWLYATLAAHADPQLFYLFDSRLSWIAPVRVSLGLEVAPNDAIHMHTTYTPECTMLTVSFPNVLLSYLQPDPLVFPLVPVERGLIIDGKVPYWLLTALTRCYKAAGVAWIACFNVPLEAAVVIYSRQASPQIGDLIPRPGW